MPKLPRSTSSATSSMASGTIPSRPAKPHPDRLKIMHLFPDRPLRRGFHGESTDFPDILADFGVISTEVWCHATEPFSLFSQAELLISWCPGEGAVFFRIKQSGPRSYLQIVANQREGGAVRQKVIATLGRTDELAARGGLASLLASGARHCEQVLLLSTLQADLEGPRTRSHTEAKRHRPAATWHAPGVPPSGASRRPRL